MLSDIDKLYIAKDIITAFWILSRESYSLQHLASENIYIYQTSGQRKYYAAIDPNDFNTSKETDTISNNIPYLTSTIATLLNENTDILNTDINAQNANTYYLLYTKIHNTCILKGIY